jgi:arginase
MNDLSLQSRLKEIQLVGVASGCGAPDPGCEAAADTLRATQMTARLRARGLRARWAPVIRPAAAYRENSLEAVRKVCERLARRVEAIVREGDLPIVVGGDHTCAIGTWKGVAHAVQDKGRIGLLWIDAHMDAHTPQTTESGMLHGMPVATLLGYGYPELTRIAEGVSLDPNCVCLYGVRSFERGEAELLARLGVRVFLMSEIEERGVVRTLNEAVSIVGCADGGFGITLDLDAIDPLDAPGVGTPEAGGLRGDELIRALAAHGARPDLIGIEIVEYNPYQDRAAATAGLVCDALDAMLVGQPTLNTPDLKNGVRVNFRGEFDSDPDFAGGKRMLVRFDSKAGSITMFGEVAVDLLKLMGQSGVLPGALLAADIPAAVERLRRGVEKHPASTDKAGNDDQAESKVSLRQRAFPLIELLERAAKRGADVIWDQERRTAF